MRQSPQPAPRTLDLVDRAWSAGYEIDTSDIVFGPDHIDPLARHGYQPYFRFFAGLVHVMGAERILEFGTWHGSATLAFARGWSSAESRLLVTIDRDQPNLEQLSRIPGVKPLTGNTDDPRLMHTVAGLFAPERVDILYYDDPRHLYEAAAMCVGGYALLLRPRVVIIDDILRSTGMRHLWSDLETRWPTRTMALNSYLPALRPEDCDLGFIDFRDLGEVP